MAYELWSIAPPNLPTRSRLYSLLPMGIGIALVESLTSYMMRLAEAHAVSPGTLVRQASVSQFSCEPEAVKSRVAAFTERAQSLFCAMGKDSGGTYGTR